MKLLLFIVFFTILIDQYSAMDGILPTTIAIHGDSQQWSKKECNSTILQIEGNTYTPICTSDGTIITKTYTGIAPITGKQNITLLLTAEVKDLNGTASLPPVTSNFTGVWPTGSTTANQLTQQVVTLQRVFPNITTTTTTVAPSATPPPALKFITEAHLTIDFIHLQYNENTKKEKTNNNSGAVAVAVIEGIALIAILAYFGYKTMVDHKRKQTTNLYGYNENNSRITVPDNIRMSDIPPPRTPVYATPATPSTSQPISRPPPVTTSPDLVVPTNTTTTTNAQFSDPFDSLDAW